MAQLSWNASSTNRPHWKSTKQLTLGYDIVSSYGHNMQIYTAFIITT